MLSALAAVVRAAGGSGSGLAGIGVSSADVAEANELGAKLAGADKGQWETLIGRKTGTSDANVLRLRIERAIDEIGSAGQLAFRKDAHRRSEYEALFHRVAAEATSADEPPEGDENAS